MTFARSDCTAALVSSELDLELVSAFPDSTECDQTPEARRMLVTFFLSLFCVVSGQCLIVTWVQGVGPTKNGQTRIVIVIIRTVTVSVSLSLCLSGSHCDCVSLAVRVTVSVCLAVSVTLSL